MNLVKQQGPLLSKLFTISQIAKTVNGKIDGNPDLTIQGVCDLDNSSADHLSYIVSDKYEKYFQQSKANAILVTKDFSIHRGNKTLIHVDNPAVSFIDVIHLFYPQNTLSEHIHPTAVISDTTKIGKNVHIGPHVVIEKNVTVGDGVQIGAGSFIGSNTIINNC